MSVWLSEWVLAGNKDGRNECNIRNVDPNNDLSQYPRTRSTRLLQSALIHAYDALFQTCRKFISTPGSLSPMKFTPHVAISAEDGSVQEHAGNESELSSIDCDLPPPVDHGGGQFLS